ncbi:MAG TPA: ABC transporter ATP-binding protein, partial [Anaerolineae bacterium]|nr:ABC transporter ATP-binding protein [Anaerolineae bacterium]
IVTLIGANGAGKTTTLKAISGLIHPASGRIEFQGQRIDRLSPPKIVALGISHVPEGRRVFPDMTVLENLEMGAFSLGDDRPRIKANLERVYQLFPILAERKTQLAGTLSGGEQQMLAIGRGLMSDPKVFLLDEPSLGLAPMLVDKIFEIIQQINHEGRTILLVEQNAYLALRIADRAYVMETGRIVLEGEAAALLDNEYVKKAYLGK